MGEYNEELVYDLRQKYAEIVGFHLEKITEAKINKSYSEYFTALEDLFTVIKHKFKVKKSNNEEDEEYKPTYIAPDEKKDKDDLTIYYDLRSTAISVANEYSSTFLGQTQEPDSIEKIERSLRELEMFLWYVMDKAKMFGSYSSNRNL